MSVRVSTDIAAVIDKDDILFYNNIDFIEYYNLYWIHFMELPKRKQIRLKGYDYSRNGAYFITICAHKKETIFCEITCRGDPCGLPHINHDPCGLQTIQYTRLGEIALQQINCIEKLYKISFDKYVVMPNHIHAIIFIDRGITDNHDTTDNRGITDNRKGCPYGGDDGISQIVGAYKSVVANEWLKICKQNNLPMGVIWQRSFHDHIIRDEHDYIRIWQYIDENPTKWTEDCLHEI
ncbi:MAG: transposase [Oscillospiraceae bacterium]|nr:transposase [Oscillospiraceae bacterium]